MSNMEWYNDEKLPNDEQIKAMQSEYKSALSDKYTIKNAINYAINNKHNYDICMPNFDIIGNLYLMEMDIVSMLHYLYMKARLDSTRKIIDSIVSIKKKCILMLYRIYKKGTSKSIDYTNNMLNKPTYNLVFRDINIMQANILMSINSHIKLSMISYNELMASALLNCIKP